MNESDNLSNEVNSEYDNGSTEINNSSNENEVGFSVPSFEDVEQRGTSERSSDPQNLDTENTQSEDKEELTTEEEEKPSSTVIQVTPDENSDTGYTIDELDVSGLNDFIRSENELRSVNPTSNDYYTWLGSDIEEYFAGIMALYPLNEYKAVHLKHWVQNTSYNSYYDDYYYLWYDYPSENVVEVYKQYNNSQYVVSYTTQRDLQSTIVYGSSQGQSDIRKGVSYVQEMGLLCAVGVCLVLYILHAFTKHLVR